MDLGGFSALQQQDEGFQAAEPVALGSRHGHDDASQQAVRHILAVNSEEVWPVLAYVGYQLVSLLLHGLIPFLHQTSQGLICLSGTLQGRLGEAGWKMGQVLDAKHESTDVLHAAMPAEP